MLGTEVSMDCCIHAGREGGEYSGGISTMVRASRKVNPHERAECVWSDVMGGWLACTGHRYVTKAALVV